MSSFAKPFQIARTVIFSLMLVGVSPVHAAYVKASSDMTVDSLNFVLGDANAQLQWTDVWQGIVTAHAADSDSSTPADLNNSILGNNSVIPPLPTNTTNVSSQTQFSVSNGDQIGNNSNAGITGSAHTSVNLNGSGTLGEGFATSSFNNFFMITNPNAQGPVNVTFSLNYQGAVSINASAGGFFSNITNFATLLLLDPSGNLLNYDLFQNIFSGTDTSISTSDQGTLSVSLLLDYNTDYLIEAIADTEIPPSYTPSPGTLPLILLGLIGMRRFCRH